MSNKSLNVAQILNRVVTETLGLSDRTIPAIPHFWISESGRFYCTVKVYINNAKDEQTMETLMETFQKPNEAWSDDLGTTRFEYRVFGSYPEPQAEVVLIKNIR